MYEYIPVPVRHVHAGEEGGPRGLPNLSKEEEKEEDEKEKNEDGDDEEEGYGGYAGHPGGGGGHDSQITLGHFCHLSPLHAASASRSLSLYKLYRISDNLLIQRNKKVKVQTRPSYYSGLVNRLKSYTTCSKK